MPLRQFPSARSAYIHVPFCARHCGYCNFTVISDRLDLADAYVAAIARELSLNGPPCEVDTLFFGGGTPTQLPPPQLTRLFEIVFAHFQPSRAAEISIEANPLDLNEEKVAILAAKGVNRLSLGMQSLDREKLTRLERDHSPDDVYRALETCRAYSIAAISIDLIFAAPGESLAAWRSDLHEVIALSPQHVSTYGLTYERGAVFFGRLQRGELQEATEEIQREMYLAAIDDLTAAAFEHYEVSNFARPGHRCRHNEAYWTGQPYFGIGPGAASFLGGTRRMNHRSTTSWLARLKRGESPVADSEALPPEDSARERLIFGMRRLEGIRLSEFAAATGFDAIRLGGQRMQRMLDHQLLEIADDSLRLTRAGLLISDALWVELV